MIFAFILLFLNVPNLACKELRWDWSTLNLTSFSFPKTFLWGCADSALQTEGVETVDGRHIENSWTEYERSANISVHVGVACERWKRFKEDFILLKKCNMTAFRFSVDWSKIEEEEGIFNERAMDHYIEMIDELLKHNIIPMFTLFHHVAPVWFMQKGGFENENNIHYFVRFSKYVFEKVHAKVPLWLTFNEPVAYAFEGYFRGHYPPGKKSLRLAGTVVKNQLNAHVAVVQEFRKIDNSCKIGLAHMCHPIDGYSKYNFFEKAVTKLFSYLMNQTTIDFFKTGKFWWIHPWPLSYNPLAQESIDFIGVNYYTHTTIKQIHPFRMEAKVRPSEKLVDISMGTDERAKVMYPEGLYRSIERVAQLNIPIYITENGAATEDPVLKEEFLKKHLYVVARALAEGYDIRGYFYWALTDCYSWNKGYKNKHGIYAVNFQTQERTFRPAVQYLLDVIKKSRGIST